MTTLSCKRCKDLILVRREPKLLQKEIAMPSLPHCLGKQYFSTFYGFAAHCNVVRQRALQCDCTVERRAGKVGDRAAPRYKSPSPAVVPTLEHLIFVIFFVPTLEHLIFVIRSSHSSTNAITPCPPLQMYLKHHLTGPRLD